MTRFSVSRAKEMGMRAKRTAPRFTVLGGILTVFLAASALRAQAPQCSNDTMKGVFTVNSNCTGSKTFGTGATATHFDFMITPDGKTITWIAMDSGVIIIGTAVRMAGREF